MRKPLTVLLILLVSLLSWVFYSAFHLREPVAQRFPSAVSTEATEGSGAKLAELVQLQPEVNYRRRTELVWKEAIQGLFLFQFDALQTREGASARVTLENGTQLDLSQDTLLIIDPIGAGKLRPQARPIVRGGELTALTPDEVWLLTSAALIHLKATTASKAEATISVEEGKQVKIHLRSGEGLALSHRKVGSGDILEKITLRETGTLSVPAPKVGEDFPWDASAAEWQAGAVDLMVSSPKDYSEVSASEITITGRTSGLGSRVLVNGVTARFSYDRHFSAKVFLKPGANSILIQLIRPGKGSVFQSLTVIRRK